MVTQPPPPLDTAAAAAVDWRRLYYYDGITRWTPFSNKSSPRTRIHQSYKYCHYCWEMKMERSLSAGRPF